ncbi:asparagine synthase (glutamine-hydrolyzing) [Roseobacter sp. HKCCD9010]|uniref:asparagine synthase (glutamine-hydrolyzing) n=1 Tax=unclassified Roseobacter TaxID=196798 RepID=UPI0014921F8C|nr:MULTISPECIES: asparagine synthase (glutamine-hydrolyzing) [unclassified Roseobacter]MBF9052545.1 asparagine synthase (glutamine-hydrolyzing) [Rhodobacterales bacterium HKCCD4356]NNV40987.1 asparagine synthase (glutamine-hydrolyzing) [Roseobacter sp. HKCCD9054]NNY43408.1 asparagine synthase (glutamine-hydrolyzing) [Roseobacter sp. HKCCD8831]NNZ83918.1 asparagine synthase (glutamine-hydrolyzing) [Roseobacter sp. HKCCD7538]NNZ92458.1 asparagine synthase (glutamine-hydrolyzing) [Roseobacter sp.
MCGFAAMIECPPAFGPVSSDKRAQLDTSINAMLETFKHRGDPEYFGETLILGNVALGTNRLAIVDRDHARQPISDVSETVWVSFNGEIYNHAELRAELRSIGHAFKTDSDTEVIAVGYMEWGIDVLNRLDGIFGFVLIDKSTNSFLIARDHIGIKPVYYARSGSTFYVASEQKGLIGLSQDIMTLDPGCYISDGRVGRYFDIDSAATAIAIHGSEREQIGECKRLLTEAVRKQVQTDLPVAVMFSAGIDSTLMLHLARLFHGNVTAFTVGVDGATDVPLAEQYCRDHGISHHVYQLSKEELVETLPVVATAAEFFEGIDAIDACVAYFGYRMARQKGFKVALCGEGSDEVLAGYDLFKKHSDPETLKRYRVGNLHRTDLQRVDRASMLNSVEARVPFLDREFLSFAYHLPMSMKIRNGVEKWVLREAFRGDLPDYLIDRPKVRMPEGSGVKNILMDFAADQDCTVPAATRLALGLDTPQSQFFASLYLAAGYPVPEERHRLPGRDYSENGYFAFAS